jgi:hypothetical protein
MTQGTDSMRCKACNRPLTPFERTRKTQGGEYPDLCNLCITPLEDEGMEFVERFDLLGQMDIYE